MKDMWVLLDHERSLKMYRKLIQTSLTWQKRTTQCNTQACYYLGLYGLVQWHVYWVLQLCLSSVLGLGQAGQNCKAVDSVPSLGQGHIPHFWSFA